MKKLLIGVVVYTTLLFLSCSPSKMIGRAVKKDPSLLKERVETIYLPEVVVDTFFSIDVDTIELAGRIDSILLSIPDCAGCLEATPKIVRVFTDRELLEDTLYSSYHIINDSLDLSLGLKVWQDGTKVQIMAELEKASINVRQSYVVNDASSKRRVVEYFFMGIFGMIVGFFLLTRIKR